MTHLAMSQIAGMNEHYRLYPLDFFLDDMVRLELEAIELWAGAPHLYIEDATAADLRRIRAGIESRGLKLICYTPEQCQYPFNIAAKEPELRARSLAYFFRSLQAASELGAPMFQTVPGWGYFDEPAGEAWERTRDALAALAKEAGKHGIVITLEPLERRGTNIVTDLPALKRMLDDIRSPHLKVIIDTCPMAAAGETFDDYFKAFGDDVRHIHFVDSLHKAWGDGDFPLADWLEELNRHRYRGYLTLEICARATFMEPTEAVLRSLSLLRSELAKLKGVTA
ncbi:sugar phosphate isomerase/epimerase family protein [Cohnella hashimotonis]|uniref:Sugar phosphate isomerase/epimerase family protein n=1 Tax=Cohnella hashimotonis TaxID=2826895 RepID=A0ABT6TTG3_9BACL|nr:sugar phosphate isomerase/epimerase family protein [Cohnella hashimotonis]MDI4650133.1 sugar phosphate isomerase/epimerase family protein [Cohnella hashimotonis]